MAIGDVKGSSWYRGAHARLRYQSARQPEGVADETKVSKGRRCHPPDQPPGSHFVRCSSRQRVPSERTQLVDTPWAHAVEQCMQTSCKTGPTLRRRAPLKMLTLDARLLDPSHSFDFTV
ncbi:hypothetical protein MRX96_037866 [Rhipicephalus microplus]